MTDETTYETKDYADPNTGEILRRVRPFAEWMQEHRRGSFADDLGLALNELVERVRTLGKAGTITVKLSVKPVGNRSENVLIGDEIVVKAPAPDHEDTMFFVDDDMNLTRHDPRQADLPGLREVPGRGEIRDVSGSAAAVEGE